MWTPCCTRTSSETSDIGVRNVFSNLPQLQRPPLPPAAFDFLSFSFFSKVNHCVWERRETLNHPINRISVVSRNLWKLERETTSCWIESLQCEPGRRELVIDCLTDWLNERPIHCELTRQLTDGLMNSLMIDWMIHWLVRKFMKDCNIWLIYLLYIFYFFYYLLYLFFH